ncbi:MAG: molybdenum ABC transporter ATP-binding protein [Bauldia sp.]|nr:molybdenum ABC transporter ATP-binding protein [Bauldia sp.]
MSLSVDVRHRAGAFALDVAFESGDGVTALFGRSGAGKSTLAGLVAGLARPAEGRIVLDGTVLVDTGRRIAVPRRKRRIGVVFQEGRLFPHMSVRQNLLFGQRFLPAAERYANPGRVVDLLGIGDLLDRRPRHLSGGEQQRVAIGRALLMSPRALIMDEPLASLDEQRKAEILPFIERLRGEFALPILYISHAVAEVARLASTVVVLDAGRVAAVGPPADVLGGSQAAFPGAGEAGSILTARVRDHDPADRLTRLVLGETALFVPLIDAAPGSEVRVHVRARDVMLAREAPSGISALNLIPARVVAVRELDGAGVEVRLAAEGATLLAQVTRRSVRELGIAPGLPLFAVLKTIAVDPTAIGRELR